MVEVKMLNTQNVQRMLMGVQNQYENIDTVIMEGWDDKFMKFHKFDHFIYNLTTEDSNNLCKSIYSFDEIIKNVRNMLLYSKKISILFPILTQIKDFLLLFEPILLESKFNFAFLL